VLLCLESSKLTVKLADFGLVETKKRIKLVSKRKRHLETLSWKAPELFSKLLGPLIEDTDDPFTDSDTDLDEQIENVDNFLESSLAMADVYSFGLLCVYILGGQLFFPGLSLSKIRIRRLEDFRPALPPTCTKDLKDLIYSSLKSEPQSRPTFSAICTRKPLLPLLPPLEDLLKGAFHKLPHSIF
jgi:serine/threonine protein kinase